jgi:phosphohistidine phosphatase
VQPRRLLVIRHARAVHGGSTDAERSLTDDGTREAEAVGTWLAGRDLRPDHALVSSARRAVETWEALARGAGWEVSPEVSQALYAAEPESALDLAREAPGEATTLALVGHNPTVGSMAQLLDDGEGDAEAGTGLASDGFPPGAVAAFELAGEWADLGWGAARLVAYRGR